MANSEKNDFQDPYIDQNSGCLRNLWHIKDPTVLSTVASTFAVKRAYDLEDRAYDLIQAYQLEAAESLMVPNYDDGRRFDFEYLKDIHRYLFSDVYEWAGQIREVDLSRGETNFLPYSLIEQGAEPIFTKLEQEDDYLQGLDANTFSEKAGYYLGEITRVHPFRDGNWRAQLQFINELANYSGYHIKWNMVNNIDHKQVIEASIEADKGKLDSMVSLIRQNLVHRNHVLDFGGKCLLRIGDSIGQAERGKNYEGPIVGATERYVMQTIKGFPHIIILHNRDSLSGPLTPNINKIVDISYPDRVFGFVRDPEILKEKGSSTTHTLEKNSYQHEDYEWER